MTSVKPAARCQLRVKERILLTPPRSVRAERCLVTEDLQVSSDVSLALVFHDPGLHPCGLPLPSVPELGPLSIVIVVVDTSA